MKRGVRRQVARWLAATVVAVAMLASGCAAADDAAAPVEQPTAASEPSSPEATAAEDRTTPTDSEAIEPTDQQANPGDEPTISESAASPITEALGVAQDEFAGAFDTYVQDAEELIRQCMAEAGFDYTPTTSGIDQSSRRLFELQDSLTQEQFTEQYGFGVSTLFELNFKGQGVVDFVNQQFGPPPIDTRSDGEQAAFEMALNGQTTQGLSPEEAQEQLFGAGPGAAIDGSCRDVGYDTAENPGAAFDGLFSLLGDELDALNERFDNDPRIRDATAEWQTCMATSGHSYENRFEILDEIQDESDALANQFLTSPVVLTSLGQAQEEGFVTMQAEDRVEFLERIGALQGFSWVPEVQAEFDDLVEFELRVASESADCENTKLFEEVQLELETDFVEQHGEQLALIAAGDR